VLVVPALEVQGREAVGWVKCKLGDDAAIGMDLQKGEGVTWVRL